MWSKQHFAVRRLSGVPPGYITTNAPSHNNGQPGIATPNVAVYVGRSLNVYEVLPRRPEDALLTMAEPSPVPAQ